MDITVRKANINDINEIVNLYEQKGWNKGRQITSEFFKKVTDIPGCYLLVAEMDDKIVGTVQLNIIQNIAFGGQPYGTVEWVITDKDHRRQGVGRKMFEEIDRICIEHNCDSVMLTSSLANWESHLFYEKMGYVAPVKGFRKEFPERAITKREYNLRRYKKLAEEEEKRY